MTHTEWCNPCLTADDRLHPKSFTAEEVSLEQMTGLRETGLKFCNVSAAEDLASTSFLSAAQLAAGQQCGQSPPLRYFRVMLLCAYFHAFTMFALSFQPAQPPCLHRSAEVMQ